MLVQGDDSSDPLSIFFVFHTNDACFRYVWQAETDRLNFGRSDLVAAGLDNVDRSPTYDVVVVSFFPANVTSLEPTIGVMGSSGSFFVEEISGRTSSASSNILDGLTNILTLRTCEVT